MSVQKFLIALFVSLILLLIGLFASLTQLSSAHERHAAAELRRYESYKLADELRQSSDDLTRMARLFVSTGDERYAGYFEEILGVRMGTQPRPESYDLVYWDLVGMDGERPRPAGAAVSLDNLMREKGFTLDEFSKLNRAKQKSDALVRMEEIAMNAVRGLFSDDRGNFTREREADMVLAREIMFSPEYLEAKKEIMTPINEFLVMLQERTAAETSVIRAESRFWIGLALIFSLSTLAICTLGFLWLRRRVLAPLRLLSAATERVTRGDYDEPVGYESRDEIGALVGAFDSMVESTRDSVTGLVASNESLEESRRELEREKQISESLLLNVLPAVIAERLRNGETTIADEFPDVSVMFADLVNFTPLSERLGPFELVKLLNEIFETFDQRLDAYGLEKIKTIGDCYMVVGGVPIPQADHAQRLGDFALAIRDDFEKLARDRDLDIQIRIGLHSGTAIAGVVGTKKFAYDLWGDVVNVASRIESTGSPGRIHVSDGFMVRLKDSFRFEPRGEVELKGKGRMETYFLEGRRYDGHRESDPQPSRS